MSRIELAIEKIKSLDENQAKALLEWLHIRENSSALREKFDAEIETGLAQLKRGEKISGADLYAEIRERSSQRRRN